MTQTVFDNAMVAHVWAQRDQEEGRSHNGNFHFRGDTLFSYRTPIGRFVNIGKDRTRYAVLVTSNSYSITTSGKHMPALWRALRGGGYVAEFRVPELGGYYADGPNRAEHEANLAHLVNEYRDRRAKVQRMRDYYGTEETLREELQTRALHLERYADLFKLRAKLPRLNPDKDAADVFAARATREAKRNTPAAIAKREADRERREEAKRRAAELERAESAERVEAWRRGEPVTLRHGERIAEHNGAYLRVKSDKLETSLGATVPLAEAVRVFRFVKLCRAKGDGISPDIVWRRNGESVPVGHFQVDWISAAGSFRAGCHLIHWPEIERAAAMAGVLEAEPSDEAVARKTA